MIIAIDESGTFVPSKNKNSWCVVGAYVFSERIQSRSYAVLKKLKRKCGVSEHQEIKLKHISEKNYFNFIVELSHLGGMLFSAATDSRINNNATVIKHRTIQVENIRKNIPKMKYEAGKKAISNLADEIEAVSPQLYVQLQCQVELIEDILCRATLYYVQRDPQTLRRFKWSIDQKNITKTAYERAFEKIAPPLLQTKSFRKPMIFLEGEDYSFMEPYQFSKEEVPSYLKEAYGKKAAGGGLNIGKIIHENMTFPNSKSDFGVQIADLLASGLRRCLRSEFTNNLQAAQLLGKLMVSNAKEMYPINFLGLHEHEEVTDKKITEIVACMNRNAKNIVNNR